MPSTYNQVSSSLVSRLRKIANATPVVQDERCSFCGKDIPDEHRHLMDINSSNFVCVCDMCVLLQAENAKYKSIPDSYKLLTEFSMPESLWNEFLIPVNMAFFVESTKHNGIVAYYPAASGATESKLKMEPWKKLQELNPELILKKDVEALIINRLDDVAYNYIIPIDACYHLIGIIRSSWEGIYGGTDVHNSIRAFFEGLKKKAGNA